MVASLVFAYVITGLILFGLVIGLASSRDMDNADNGVFLALFFCCLLAWPLVAGIAVGGFIRES